MMANLLFRFLIRFSAFSNKIEREQFHEVIVAEVESDFTFRETCLVTEFKVQKSFMKPTMLQGARPA